MEHIRRLVILISVVSMLSISLCLGVAPEATNETQIFFFIHPSGALWQSDLEGQNSRLAHDFGARDRWFVVDFDVARKTEKVAVVVNHKAPPDDHGFEMPDGDRLEILNLRDGSTLVLAPGADWVKYIHRPMIGWRQSGDALAFIKSNEVWLYECESRKYRQVGELFVPDPVPFPHGSRSNVGVQGFAWSSTGDWLLALKQRLSGTGISYLSVVDAETGEAKMASENDCFNPVATPGGMASWIRRDDREVDNNKIFVCNPKTMESHPVSGTNGAAWGVPFAWSLGDKYVAFGHRGAKQSMLRVIDAKSGELCFEVSKGANPHWIDERTFLYTAGGAIWKANVEMGEAKKLIERGSLPEDGNVFLAVKSEERKTAEP